MEFISEHVWRRTIATRLAPELEKHAIPADNSDWEYIENEAAKIGTISHDTVKIPEVQEAILKLLSTETKDFRLLAHFINTLQRSGQPEQIILAIALLADHIDIFWNIASPQKLKKRIVQMIVQRFSMAKNDFYTNAIQEERDESTAQFIRLKQLLQENYPDLCDEVDKLIVSYAKQPSVQTETGTAPKTESAPRTAAAQSSAPAAAPHVMPNVTIDQSSEQAWRKTLLKIVEIETSKSINQPIVFQLRRHVVWSSLHAPISNNGVTTVPPIPPEKTSEYERELSKPNVELWQKIENTISYSPYWFDGHYMSALIANKLGYTTIADVIKNELIYFLDRFPECKTLQYSNGKPFASDVTLKWLNKKPVNSTENEDYSKALTIYEESGLQQALAYLEQVTTEEPRSLFHAQALSIQLLNAAGCYKLAKQQLDNLRAKATQLTVTDWEPSFFERCNELEEQIGNKE